MPSCRRAPAEPGRLPTADHRRLSLVGRPELLEPRRPVGLAAREVRLERVEVRVPAGTVTRDGCGRQAAMVEDEDGSVAVGPELEAGDAVRLTRVRPVELEHAAGLECADSSVRPLVAVAFLPYEQ